MRANPRYGRLRLISLACASTLVFTACDGGWESFLGQFIGQEAPADPAQAPDEQAGGGGEEAPAADPATGSGGATGDAGAGGDAAGGGAGAPGAGAGQGPGAMPDPEDMEDPGMAHRPDTMPNPDAMDGMDAGAAPVGTDLTAAQQAAVASTMKVVANGCEVNGSRVGSGFVVDSQLIATNAHVVAGSDEQFIVLDGDTDNPLLATVVAFDAQADIALLAVPELDRPALPIATAEIGEEVDGLGYPGDALTVEPSPARITERIVEQFEGIGGTGPAEREAIILAGDVDPGDSGSALVDDEGSVVGVVFGVLIDQFGDELDVVLAVSERELLQVMDAPRSEDTDTGRCA